MLDDRALKVTRWAAFWLPHHWVLLSFPEFVHAPYELLDVRLKGGIVFDGCP